MQTETAAQTATQGVRDIRESLLWSLRERNIRKARKDFWTYCKLQAPEFYKESRPHLKKICVTLQKFWGGKLRSPKTYKVYSKLMMNIPPRFGKSRTLTLFISWVFGKDPSNKVISGSYNDKLAQDFSKYTRNIITRPRETQLDVIYQDVFPGIRIRRGTSAAQNWALEGYHFSYKGVGMKGSATGKGADWLVVDDPVKDSEVAFNQNTLDDIWQWFSSTFMQRLEEGGRIIVNMTRWAKADICGRLLGEFKDPGEKDISEPEDWYILKMEAKDRKTGDMLCPELLSKESYENKKSLIDDAIFSANFHQETIDIKGRLYTGLKTYEDIPRMEDGTPDFDNLVAYGDTADEGDDFLCLILAGVKGKKRYLLDVYYTDEKMEKTEPKSADFLYDGYYQYGYIVNTRIESNNGGKGFARAVKRLLREDYDGNGVNISWFHQSKNKRGRIVTYAPRVIKYMFFPQGWHDIYPNFYRAMTTYQRKGKNRHDDGPDATTGIIESTSVDNKITAGAGL